MPSPSKASTTDSTLAPIVQERLPELRLKFPELAKSLEEALKPTPTSPAAALHGAQSQCQKAFKTLQAAERMAVDLEKEAADLVTALRDKVRDLHDAQAVLNDARRLYEKAAATAQAEISKQSTKPDEGHVTALIGSLGHDDLEKVAKALSEAAADKKDEYVQSLVAGCAKVLW